MSQPSAFYPLPTGVEGGSYEPASIFYCLPWGGGGLKLIVGLAVAAPAKNDHVVGIGNEIMV
jgi:hypothetical protein